MIYLARNMNRGTERNENVPQDQGWLAALKVATKRVYIQSPNFTTRTIADAVVEAVLRGVRVLVVTSFRFHETYSKLSPETAGSDEETFKYMADKIREADPERVKLLSTCFFLGKRVKNSKPDEKEFAHTKFMAVDDTFVILGSGNQDPQSWYYSSEGNILIDDPTETKRLVEKVLSPQQTLDHCFSTETTETKVTW